MPFFPAAYILIGSRYGQGSVHFPKTLGMQMIGEGKYSPHHNRSEVLEEVEDVIRTPEDTLSSQSIGYEKSRRLHAKKISSALKYGLSEQDPQEGNLASISEESEEEQFPVLVTLRDISERYFEVKNFLLANRQKLAFDTMHFEMGEHVLISHIRGLPDSDIKTTSYGIF